MRRSLIYLAEDEPEVRALLEETLQFAGYDVVGHPDGTALLRGLGSVLPDLILLDVQMPGLNGWEVRKELLQRPGCADVPVIAVTAEGGASVEASALESLNFAGFVRKPFRLGDLLDQVDRALARRPGAPAGG